MALEHTHFQNVFPILHVPFLTIFVCYKYIPTVPKIIALKMRQCTELEIIFLVFY
jgi:hypothetical protein